MAKTDDTLTCNTCGETYPLLNVGTHKCETIKEEATIEEQVAKLRYITSTILDKMEQLIGLVTDMAVRIQRLEQENKEET